ncbi:ATP-binding cassette domain-containing protein, partial [Enterococcus faecium]|uniref:ATP-binding cassette domain-containing protein n=1 Tax=Enterococcus faecium TaxID=1352 RepID=UPI003CC5AF9D
TVNKGVVVTIIGSSGSCKSTFMRSINLLEKPTGGEIIYNGEKVLAPKNNLPKYRTNLGMVFHSFNLFNNMNVLENCMS